MNKYAIKTNVRIPGRHTMYVMSVRGGLATFTDRFPLVKTFSTRAAANRFRRRYESETDSWTVVNQPSVVN